MRNSENPTMTTPIFRNCDMITALKCIYNRNIAVKPDHLFKNRHIPLDIWLNILSFIELPFTLEINQLTAQQFRYRPITIAWNQVPRISHRLVGISRDTLYSCDTSNMVVFKNESGENCFGVRPQILFRSTPLLRIKLYDRSIMGFMAHTAVLPFNNIPYEFRVKIDPKDPKTWVYETESPLHIYAYRVWEMKMKREAFASFQEIYTTITWNQFVCTHELTPCLNMSKGTYFEDDDSIDTEPLSYLRDKASSESPLVHLTPFKDADGDITTTVVFYPSLDANFVEYGVTITSQSSPETVRNNCVSPENVLHELDRISDYWNTPMCPRCNIPLMCTITCCGPTQDIKTVMSLIMNKLNRLVPIKTNQAINHNELTKFKGLLFQWNNGYNILVSQFIEDFYMYFSFDEKLKPEIQPSEEFSIITNFSKMDDFALPQFKRKAKRRGKMTSKRISSKLIRPSISIFMDNKNSSSETEDDDMQINMKSKSLTKRQKLNNGSSFPTINVQNTMN